MHQTAAQQGAQWVSVIGQNKFRHFRLRIMHRARHQHLFAHSLLLPTCANSSNSASGEPVRTGLQSRLPSTRNGRNYFLFLSLLYIGLQKAFRHSLHPGVTMRLFPTITCHIELNDPTLGRTMISFAHIANLNASARPSFSGAARASSPKANRIPLPISRQTATTRGVSKVAELLQFSRCGRLTLVPRAGAVPAP